jgi:hypothetical protein
MRYLSELAARRLFVHPTMIYSSACQIRAGFAAAKVRAEPNLERLDGVHPSYQPDRSMNASSPNSRLQMLIGTRCRPENVHRYPGLGGAGG